MTLSYRGLTYEGNFSKSSIESNIFATYRGVAYNITRPITYSNSQPQNLQYRGLSYTVERLVTYQT